jgi:hypothetical protein
LAADFPFRETLVSFVFLSSLFFVTPVTLCSKHETGGFCPNEGSSWIAADQPAKFFEINILPANY